MKIFTYLSLLFLLLACGSAEDTAAEAAAEKAGIATQDVAYKSMMDGHDRIMPLMGQITQAQRSITEQLNMGGHEDDYRELLLAANEQLEDADDGMNDWMNSIRPLDELRANNDENGVMEFITEHTRKVADVETNIKTSLANAAEVIADDHVHGPGADHQH